MALAFRSKSLMFLSCCPFARKRVSHSPTGIVLHTPRCNCLYQEFKMYCQKASWTETYGRTGSFRRTNRKFIGHRSFQCRAKMAHTRKSWPYHGLGFQLKGLTPYLVPSLLGSGMVTIPGLDCSTFSLTTGRDSISILDATSFILEITTHGFLRILTYTR